jgi:hypothetical protein
MLGKFPDYNGSLLTSLLLQIMKFLRALLPIAIATVLTACGGTDPQTDTSFQTAAVMQTVEVPAAGTAAQSTQSAMPQPDCAPEGCKGLRIIDGNAEAYRLAAMERKQREVQDPGA